MERHEHGNCTLFRDRTSRATDSIVHSMGFVRFVLSELDRDSGVESGPFELAYQLRDSPDVESADRDVLAELVSERRVGYLTYEDTFQVVAEPFSDTQTG
jgi:hypothetical protein